jgi:hypothetical protein
MPLRDHFHPPVSKRSSWEGFKLQNKLTSTAISVKLRLDVGSA